MQSDIFSHKSGIRVALVREDSPMSSVSVWFRAGSRFDMPGKEGVAHFFEHLLVHRGTTGDELLRRLRGLASKGIEASAHTTYETAHYICTQPVEETRVALVYLLDAISTFRASEEAVERERLVIIGEQREEQADRDARIRVLANAALWPSGPLTHGILGDERSVSAVTHADIEAFARERYRLADASLLVVGNMTRDDLETMLDEVAPAHNAPISVGAAGSDAVQHGTPTVRQYVATEDQDCSVSISYLGASYTDERARLALDLLTRVLAGNWNSRLVEELRVKRNLAYWVSGNTANMGDTGYARFVYAVPKERTEESIAVCKAEIARLAAEPMNEAELQSHIAMYRAELLRLTRRPDDLVWWFGYQFRLSGTLPDPAANIRTIESFTAQELLEHAKRYFGGEASVVTVGGA